MKYLLLLLLTGCVTSGIVTKKRQGTYLYVPYVPQYAINPRVCVVAEERPYYRVKIKHRWVSVTESHYDRIVVGDSLKVK